MDSTIKPDAAFLDAYKWMEESFSNLFITGKAGTGKSTLVEYFKKHTKKKYVVLASTGVAAMHVGGQTIHSFFGFPPRVMRPGDPEIMLWENSKPQKKIVNQLDTLIIDEVSMVRADLLDAISESLQLQLANKEPFGGVQVILVGDAFQLAPVDRDNAREDDFSLPERRMYKSAFFFSADAFKQGGFKIVELMKVWRQSETTFVNLLNQIRTGQIDETTLHHLNNHVDEGWEQRDGILLSTTNALADRENARQLDALKGKTVVLQGAISGKFPDNMMRADLELRLKKGARVMTLTNDPERRWQNGSIGTVIEFKDDEETESKGVLVELDHGGVVLVTDHQWENASYGFNTSKDEINRRVNGTYRQMPLRLAWGITIHKSQGLGFDNVRLHLGNGSFAPGQLYVALSRCRSLKGLCLVKQIRPQDIIVSEVVTGFYAWFQRQVNAGNDLWVAKPRRPQPQTKNTEDQKKLLDEAKASRAAKREKENLAIGKRAKEGARWKAEEVEMAIAMWNGGESLSNIAEKLQRSNGSVNSKLIGSGMYVAYVPEKDLLLTLAEGMEAPPGVPGGNKMKEDWSKEERQRLIEMYNNGEQPFAMSQVLNRSIHSMVWQLERAGVFIDLPATFGPYVLSRRFQ